MRLTGILILIFLLTAFTIGSNIPEDKIAITDSALDNATIEIDMINLDSQTNSTIPNMEGLMDVLERYVKFVGAFFIEVMRAGIHFGNDNPDYFEPSFIIQAIKLIVILFILGLLIKPLGYLVIMLIMLGMYIFDKIRIRKKGKSMFSIKRTLKGGNEIK